MIKDVRVKKYTRYKNIDMVSEKCRMQLKRKAKQNENWLHCGSNIEQVDGGCKENLEKAGVHGVFSNIQKDSCKSFKRMPKDG